MSAGNPFVSVLMPVYNGGPLLEPAVRSVLGQTYEDLELIVVDDASVDGSADVLARLADEDDRIRIMTHALNGGLVKSLNDGLSLCRGTVVARLDADDRALPTRIARQVEQFLDDKSLVLSATAYRRVDVTGATIRTGNPPRSHAEFAGLMLAGNRLCHSTVMFRRETVDSVGGYRSEWFPVEDYDLWLRLARAGRYAAVESEEVIYLDNPHGISTTRMAEQAAKLDVRSRDEIASWAGTSGTDSGSRARVRSLALAYRSLSRDLRDRRIEGSGLASAVRIAALYDLRGIGRVHRHTSLLISAPKVTWDSAKSRRSGSMT